MESISETTNENKTFDERKKCLISFINDRWDNIESKIDHLLNCINKNADPMVFERIQLYKEKIFTKSETSGDSPDIDQNDINNLEKRLINSIRGFFPMNSKKFNSIFSSIYSIISQIKVYLDEYDQLEENSSETSSQYSKEPIKNVFIDNMRNGITSLQVENFEKRKQLKNDREKVELFDFLTQENMKYIAKSLLYYQEYRLQIESPQDSAKIEKRMFKSSLDLIFVANAMTAPDKPNNESKPAPDKS